MIKEKPAVINTQRLSLKSMSDCDKERAIELFIHPEVYKTYLIPDFKSEDEKVALFNKIKNLSLMGSRFVYGVYLNNNLIGFVNEVCTQNGEIELGYVISPNQKNNGFATEALSACIKELFNMGYSAVKTGAFECNHASIRVMQKCGMQKIDYTEDIDYRGKINHCIFYEKRV